MTLGINPHQTHPSPFMVEVYTSTGYQTHIDGAALRNAVDDMARVVNHNAMQLNRLAEFFNWAVTSHPVLIEEFHATLIAERLET